MKLLGKGTFSRVYHKDSNRVLIKTKDLSKIALAENELRAMFPRLTKIEIDYQGVYHLEGKKYSKIRSPKKELNDLGFKRYNILKEVEKEYHSFNIFERKKYISNYERYYEIFSKIKDKYLKETLIESLDTMANYGSDMVFEISPRNIGKTEGGRLILLDCWFFESQLREVRDRRRERIEARL